MDFVWSSFEFCSRGSRLDYGGLRRAHSGGSGRRGHGPRHDGAAARESARRGRVESRERRVDNCAQMCVYTILLIPNFDNMCLVLPGLTVAGLLTLMLVNCLVY